MKEESKINISFRYKLALSIIALLSFLAYLNLTNLIKKQSKYAEIINISGRQRMLSQQIALYAINYKISELKSKIKLMEKSHKYLTSLKNMPPSVKKIFFEKPIFLDKRVKKYIKEAKNFYETTSGKSLAYVLNHSQKLLKDLDKVVLEFQKESEKQTLELVKKERYILFLTLFTLLIEALFIFRPAIKKIEEYMKKLIDEKIFEETVIKSSPAAVIAVDENMKVNVFNKTAEKIFGYEKSEMLGKDSLKNIIPKEYYEDHKKGFYNFLKTGELKHKESSLELEGVRKNGEKFAVRISFGSAQIDNKKIVVANIEDIEKEKEKDRMLIQQSRIAALGEMIGNIAHQWRQPLNAIKIVASGIKMKRKANLLKIEEVEKEMDKIINYTDYLSQTIDDFRYFFKQEKTKESFDILNIIQRAISLVEASYKHNNIKIYSDFKDDSYIYKGYPNELAQVLLNILNNAKDVLIEREVKNRLVKISLYKEEDEIKIKICDNAGGVDEDIIVKIFDPYFTTKHKSQGTGIGLYMSKQIIEKHFNGLLYVKNEKFRIDDKEYYGACFSITLKIV